MDENEEYGQEMTEPLLTSSIKKKKIAPSRKGFNILLGKVSIEDKSGHLFAVDIFLDLKK